MSEEELDNLLCMIYMQPNRERGFYERNADAIGMLERRCLVTAGRDELGELVSAEVTYIGRWFLMRGGFQQEARESRLAEREQAREEAMKSIAKSSNRIAIFAMIAASVSASVDLVHLLIPYIPGWVNKLSRLASTFRSWVSC